MTHRDLEWLMEAAWRRDLTPEESKQLRQLLADNRAAAELLAGDLSLGKTLRQLPPVPVSSNFTSLVLQELARQEKASNRRPGKLFWADWRRWLPRLAIGGAVCSVIAMGTWHYHITSERTRLADSVQRVTTMAFAAAPKGALDVQVLENFEVIRRLGNVSADEELLAVVKNQ
jgi:anti-sigma factor RsiW